MRLVALVIPLIPLVANAENGRDASTVHESSTATPVIGGADAVAGKWPDVAAVNFGGSQGCTGTLIAPTVVLTAGHCNEADLDNVLVGTTSLARPQDGEMINVMKRIEYPSSQSSEDLTVLVLAEPARVEPRRIASGWAQVRHQERRIRRDRRLWRGRPQRSGHVQQPGAVHQRAAGSDDDDHRRRLHDQRDQRLQRTPRCPRASSAPAAWASTPAPATRAARCTCSPTTARSSRA